jgi:iron complex transport system ATP-binding protein
MSGAVLLETRGLRLAVGERELISTLDWQVQPGQLWCLLGRNGAGKTTLLQSLAGLRKPVAGQLSIAGEDPARSDPARLARLRGFMAQERSDAFSWPVLDTVLLGRTPWRVGAQWDSAEEHAMAESALQQVGLEGFARRDIQRLSGGERQRVALAALLVQAPPLMLLDEPLSHQDVAQQLKLMALLRALPARHAVVMSCHDINLAARFASHVLLLGAQRHWQGSTAAVLNPENLQAAYGCEFSDVGGMFVPQIAP